MVWMNFWFGAAAVLGTEFLLTLLGVAVAILRSERATKKLLKKAKKQTDKVHD